jgi:predicted 2-oxoglutarate/Fe(II)-dependent dioxygenase YbiX
MTPDPIFTLLDNVLDEATCVRVRRAMDTGTPEAAEILDNDITRDDQARRTAHIEVDDDTLAFLEQRLDAQRHAIERFFTIALGPREGLSLLRYRAGDFFRPHRDWGIVPSWPDAERRRISLVLFLTTSRAVDPSGTFSGGALRLFDDEGAVVREVVPRSGTLVAFPSTMLHEVAPVVSGVRDAVVDWWY